MTGTRRVGCDQTVKIITTRINLNNLGMGLLQHTQQHDATTGVESPQDQLHLACMAHQSTAAS